MGLLDANPEFDAWQAAKLIVMSFATADDATVAVLMLHARGFDPTEVLSYTSAQRRPDAAAGQRCAGLAGRWARVPRLVAAQRVLALRGYSFVVANASSPAKADAVTQVARQSGAHAAQRCGPYGSEELLDRFPSGPPPFEPHARHAGREPERAAH